MKFSAYACSGPTREMTTRTWPHLSLSRGAPFIIVSVCIVGRWGAEEHCQNGGWSERKAKSFPLPPKRWTFSRVNWVVWALVEVELNWHIEQGIRQKINVSKIRGGRKRRTCGASGELQEKKSGMWQSKVIYSKMGMRKREQKVEIFYVAQPLAMRLCFEWMKEKGRRGEIKVPRVGMKSCSLGQGNFYHEGITFCCKWMCICIMAKLENFSIPFDK